MSLTKLADDHERNRVGPAIGAGVGGLVGAGAMYPFANQKMNKALQNYDEKNYNELKQRGGIDWRSEEGQDLYSQAAKDPNVFRLQAQSDPRVIHYKNRVNRLSGYKQRLNDEDLALDNAKENANWDDYVRLVRKQSENSQKMVRLGQLLGVSERKAKMAEGDEFGRLSAAYANMQNYEQNLKRLSAVGQVGKYGLAGLAGLAGGAGAYALTNHVMSRHREE